MNYALARRKAKKARSLIEDAAAITRTIDDEHLITERTVMDSLIRRFDKYIAALQDREQKSKRMKKRHASTDNLSDP